MGALLGRVFTKTFVAAYFGIFLLYVWYAPAGGYDFRIFNAVATLLRHHADPYNQTLLLAMERQLYPVHNWHEHLQVMSIGYNPFVESPILGVFYLPFSFIGSRLAQLGVTAVFVLLNSVALLVVRAAVRLHWTEVVAMVCSPIALLAPLLGQPDAIMLLGAAVGGAALVWKRPTLAGAALTLLLLKPQLAAGFLVIYAIVWWHRGRLVSYLWGVVLGCAAQAGVAMVFYGPDVFYRWIHTMLSFSQTTVYVQVDISSLSAFSLLWLPRHFITPMALLLMAGWVVLGWRTIVSGRMMKAETQWIILMLTTWMLVTPYAHSADDVILLPALAASGLLPWRLARRSLRRAMLILWWVMPELWLYGTIRLLPGVLQTMLYALRGGGIVLMVSLGVLCLIAYWRALTPRISTRDGAAWAERQSIAGHQTPVLG